MEQFAEKELQARGFGRCDTGDGCVSFGKKFASGHEITITNLDGDAYPEDGSIMVGLYHEGTETGEGVTEMETLEEMLEEIARLEKQVGEAAEEE